MEDKLVFTFLGLLAAVTTAGVLGIVVHDMGFDDVVVRANALTSAGLIGISLAGNVLLTAKKSAQEP